MRARVSAPRPRRGLTWVVAPARGGDGGERDERGAGRLGGARRQGGGPHGGLEPGRRPQDDPAGARAATAVRAQQHAGGQLLLARQGPVARGGARDGLER